MVWANPRVLPCRSCRYGSGVDLPTRANTIPVTGYPRVSATRSHARTRGWLYLPCTASHTYQGKFFIYLLPPSLTYPHQLPSRDGPRPLCLEPTLPRAHHLEHTSQGAVSRRPLPMPFPPHATSSPPPRSRCLKTGLAHAISHPVPPRGGLCPHHLHPTPPRAHHLDPAISRRASPTPSPAPRHLEPAASSPPPRATLSRRPSRGGLCPCRLPPHAASSPPPRSRRLKTGLAHAISRPTLPRGGLRLRHLRPTPRRAATLSLRSQDGPHPRRLPPCAVSSPHLKPAVSRRALPMPSPTPACWSHTVPKTPPQPCSLSCCTAHTLHSLLLN